LTVATKVPVVALVEVTEKFTTPDPLLVATAGEHDAIPVNERETHRFGTGLPRPSSNVTATVAEETPSADRVDVLATTVESTPLGGN
jgi:hypothetical protein